MKEVIPAEAVSYAAITYHRKIAVRSQVIYSVLLLAVIAALVSLPFIYVDIGVKSSGILQSNLEKHIISAPVSGRVVKYNLQENRKVAPGEILLAIASAGIEAQQGFQDGRMKELQMYLADVDRLLSNGNALTPQYVAGQQQYRARLTEADNRLQKAQIDFKRNESLWKEKVIAPAEFEKIALEYKQAQAAYELVQREQVTGWQADARKYREEMKDLESKQTQLAQDRQSYTIAAPVKGALQEVVPLPPGSFVFANQKLGTITPDTGLIALLHISPRDIGLIKVNQRVKMQIDAFNYNEWGTVTGRINEIAADVTVPENGQSPYFKVKCQLDKNNLQLKNGYKGSLSKGMTLRANMIVTRRNLYQLLYDKVDDWLNPQRSTI